MKKYLYSILAATLSVMMLPACSDDDTNEVETVVTYESLPQIAQKFLSDYFGGKQNVSKIEQETDNDVMVYDVDLKDGFEIVFNSEGYWQEIDAPMNSSVPMEVIPEQIAQTLNQQYPDYGVSEINTAGQNYHVELSNNQGGVSIELMLNQSGEIISTSMN